MTEAQKVLSNTSSFTFASWGEADIDPFEAAPAALAPALEQALAASTKGSELKGEHFNKKTPTAQQLAKRKEASITELRQFQKQFKEAMDKECKSWVDCQVYELVDLRKFKPTNFVTGDRSLGEDHQTKS